MKILSCITDVKEILSIKKAGADEVYFAYKDILNYGNYGSLSNFKDVELAIKIAHKNKMKIYLAANGFDSENEIISVKEVIKKIKKVVDMGIDAIIVANIGVLSLIGTNNINVPIHISSVNPIFNTQTLDFLSIFKNIRRIIFPNQLSGEEAKEIINIALKNNIETEVFYFKFFGCPYINGYCNLHNNGVIKRLVSDQSGLCVFGSGKNEAFIKNINKFKKINYSLDKIINRVISRVSCGGSPRILNISSFFDFYMYNVNCVKYGTRTDITQKKINSIIFIKKAIDFLDNNINKYDKQELKKIFIEKFK